MGQESVLLKLVVDRVYSTSYRQQTHTKTLLFSVLTVRTCFRVLMVFLIKYSIRSITRTSA